MTAARTAALGAQNLQKAAASLGRFRSLAEALSGGGNGPAVTDGISPQGLQPAAGYQSNPGLWVGASTGIATGADPVKRGTTDVTITQTQPVADLSWQHFSVGAHTKLTFNQNAGGVQKTSWVVINTLQSASTDPTTVLGEIDAPGKVYVINRNGIAFGAGSVVNVGALVASTAVIAQNQFGTDAAGNLTFNLYGSVSGTTYLPTFSGGAASAAVTVAPGASIQTSAPSGSSEGGYVMLLGGQVSNGGVIGTPRGQTILAAGTAFQLRPGYSAAGNVVSTTLGSEIAVTNGGTVSNTGVIVADQGDITMVGHLVDQEGALLSTTTVNQRGTVHLLTDNADATAQVILGQNSLTEILPEDNGATALDSQRAADIALSATYNADRLAPQGPRLNDNNALADRLDEGRIEVSTGGTFDAQAGALAIAQGGQVAVAAAQRIVLEGGSTLDVSGTNSAVLPASVNALLVNIQGFQLRDSAGNRNSGLLSSANVYVDARQLVEIASGAYAGNVYTPGGLLEVGGYLGLVPHGILEWTSEGGQVTLQAQSPIAAAASTVAPSGAVLVQPGAVINLTGGVVTYLPGAIPQSYLLGTDGEIYNVNTAPGDRLYVGVYKGDVVDHKRWNVTQTYVNPLVTPASLPSPGYVVGHDAGTLTVDAATAVLQGDVAAGVSYGQYQTGARPAGVTDPFLLAQSVVPEGGSLRIGNYLSGLLNTQAGFSGSIVFGPVPAGASASTATIAAGLADTVLVDAAAFNAADFASVTASTAGSIVLQAPIAVAAGGSVVLSGHVIEDAASITSQGGSITLTNLLPGSSTGELTSGAGTIAVAAGATLNARGVWTNAVLDPTHVAGEGLANGGSIAIDSTGGLTLAAGSTLDVGSGGAFLAGGKLLAARGGSISLSADLEPSNTGTPAIYFDTIDIGARLVGEGVAGGGTLTVAVPEIRVGGSSAGAVDDFLLIGQSFFQSGFGSYALNGYLSTSVAPGEQIEVVEPVLTESPGAPLLPTGGDPSQAYDTLLLPEYYPNRGSDTFSQRPGASLSLSASIAPQIFSGGGGPLSIGSGAVLTVDPGQSITLAAYGQVSVFGTLVAHGGTISVLNTRGEAPAGSFATPQPSNYTPDLSIWLDATSRLDVSGQVVQFADAQGRVFGAAANGGTIDLGAPAGTDAASGLITYAQIVVRPGAVLDLNGASTQVSVISGAETGSLLSRPNPVLLPGNGGTLVARSFSGIALEGTVQANGSGPGAAGGALRLALDTIPNLADLEGLAPQLYGSDEVIVSQAAEPVASDPALLPGAALPASTIGVAHISQAQLAAAGFDAVSLAAPNAIAFDGTVDLHVARSIELNAPVLGDTTGAAGTSVTIAAPYVQLAGPSSSVFNNSIAGSLSPLPSGATLQVSADLIDFVGSFILGADFAKTYVTGSNNGTSTTDTFTTTLSAFGQASFLSAGDIRFADYNTDVADGVETSGNLTFDAAQLYPVTGATYGIFAGEKQVKSNNYTYTGTISILRHGAAPATPFSVGGTLALVAKDILQAGILRAPEGEIILGTGNLDPFGRASPVTGSVTLAPGSVTSVSLDGASIPYGGTADGVSYTFAGNPAALFNPTILLQGQAINIEGASAGTPAANVDISGGGTLAGSAFIFGRGGSVDVNKTPLLASGAGVSATASNGVFAILPGYASHYAPVSPGDTGYDIPGTGQQITVGAGEVPGLPAGTYTLLPAYYDLLPGAYRVELATAPLPANAAAPYGNYTTLAAVQLGVANTSIQTAVPSAALFTSSTGVRQLAQYDTESYNQFEVAQAAIFNSPRPLLPQDAKTLAINFDAVSATGSNGTTQSSSFSIAPGTLDQAPGSGGFGATVELDSPMPIEIVPQTGDPGEPTLNMLGVVPHATIAASQLDALQIPRLLIGGVFASSSMVGGPITSGAGTVVLQPDTPEVLLTTGVDLMAGDVMLTAYQAPNFATGLIDVAGTATISTIGEPASAYGYANGYVFQPYFRISAPVLDVSNVEAVFLPTVSNPIRDLITVASGATLLAGGSLDFVAPQGASVEIGQAKLGATYVDVQVAAIDIGSASVLNATAGSLPPGFDLTSETLRTLLDGDPGAGVPATQQLILTATEDVNIIGGGTLALDTGSTGLVLNTPAIYGYGSATDAVSITAKSFTWSGISTKETLQSGVETLTVSSPAGGQIAGSDSHILGALSINAGQIVLGTGPLSQPNDQVQLDRLLVGFGAVTLHGETSISANGQSALSVYATQPVAGQPGSGGTLTFDTPLLTTASGARLAVNASGGFALDNSSGIAANTDSVATLGGEIDLTAQSVSLDSAVALPGGRLNITANGSQDAGGTITGATIDLLTNAMIDLSGRTTPIFNQNAESPGGTLSLQSASGIVSSTTTTTTTITGDGSVSNTETTYRTSANPDLSRGNDINVAAGAVINVSSPGAAAGGVVVSALGGTVAFAGSLLGSAPSTQSAGSFSILAGDLGATTTFDGLNALLDAGGVTGSRSFELGRGDILVDRTVKAHNVQIVADGGSIEVASTIDASGVGVGRIDLAAADNVTIDPGARLDAHATGVKRDSYGLNIDAENRAHITLTSEAGTLTIDPGATFDLRYGTADPTAVTAPQGQLVLNAPRAPGNDGVQAAVPGSVTILGAASIDLFAFRSYSPNANDPNGTVTQNPITINGSTDLNIAAIAADDAAFGAKLAANVTGLATQLAGLVPFGAGFNLEPGVLIQSQPGGNLTLSGDIDLSTLRISDPALFGRAADGKAGDGSGEPGSIVFRAAGDLTINGSVTDGFAAPPDQARGITILGDNGWMFPLNGTRPTADALSADILLPSSSLGTDAAGATTMQIELQGSSDANKATHFSTLRPISLNYDIMIQPASVQANATIPFQAAVGTVSAPIPAGGWIATAPVLRGGQTLFAKGALIPAGFTFEPGDVLGAGTQLPVQVALANNTLVPAGTPLDIFAGTASGGSFIASTLYLSQNTGVLPADALIPSGTAAAFDGVFGTSVAQLTTLDYRAPNAQGVQGYIYPLAELLPAGSLSWNLDFTAGGNLGSADVNAVLPSTLLNAGGLAGSPNTVNQAPGSLLIDDQHYSTPATNVSGAVPAFSVIRTGTGDLSLQAGGNVDQSSLFGIYTAGTPDPLPYSGTGADPNRQFDQQRTPYGPCVQDKCKLLKPTNHNIGEINRIIDSSYKAYYPTAGGDLRLMSQGDITGDVIGQAGSGTVYAGGLSSDLVGNWLWRQGTSTAVSGKASQPTAWWINFGTYVEPLNSSGGRTSGPAQLVGFQGIGTLGGGNLTVIAGGDAGQVSARDNSINANTVSRGEGLVLAVASTGRVLPGATSPVLSGGGSLTVQVAGAINPLDEAAYANTPAETGTNGDIIDIRGSASVSAGAIGRVDYLYTLNANDPRPLNTFAPQDGIQYGGISLVLGDASINVDTSRDLVIAGAGDAGREPEQSLTANIRRKLLDGQTGFSLWTANSAITLFSAGGNVTPTTVPENVNYVVGSDVGSGQPTNISPTDYRELYPPTLSVTAATGDIIYGSPQHIAFGPVTNGADPTAFSLETAPSAFGQVAFLAGQSINANGYVVDVSGTNPLQTSSIFDPAFGGNVGKRAGSAVTNVRVGDGTAPSPLALFAFQADTPTTDLHAGDKLPAMFYAGSGDIINFQTGEILNFGSNDPVSQWYLAAKPVWLLAGQDIVASGVRPQLVGVSGNEQNLVPDSPFVIAPTTTGNLFLNTGGNISVVSAGRDIVSSYFYVGGSGLLEVDAGRNIYQNNTLPNTSVPAFGDIKSLGSLIQGAPISLTDGASLAVLAGIGSGPDYSAFASLYFNPANQANLSVPLSDPSNRGKVQLVYAAQLAAMLTQEYGYTGDAAGALAFFDTLPAVNQAVIVRGVFYQEILASGRQYNDAASLFFHDYARGRQAIDTLFPSRGTETVPGVPVGYNGTITTLGNDYLAVQLSSNSGVMYVPAASGCPAGAASCSGPYSLDSGITTLFGGGIQVLDPGGSIIAGLSAAPAGGNSGVVTFGSGDVDVFALGSVVLGQSRIFTTDGGNILIWSADGDINAGIGTKTSVTFNPPLEQYDSTGGIIVTPPASSSGAGIATLQSLPNVAAGNIDLIAPLGTIDAGEAGIRVSGNLNLAAAKLVNTANITVKGSTAGVPTVTVASLGAVEAAAGAAGAAASVAQNNNANRNGGNEQAASVFEAEVVSIGGTYEEEQKRKQRGL